MPINLWIVCLKPIKPKAVYFVVERSDKKLAATLRNWIILKAMSANSKKCISSKHAGGVGAQMMEFCLQKRVSLVSKKYILKMEYMTPKNYTNKQV